MALVVRNLTANAGNPRDAVSIPGLGRSGEDRQGCDDQRFGTEAVVAMGSGMLFPPHS